MIVGVVKETFPGERRVALVPAVLPLLAKSGLEVLIESGAGAAAGYADGEYADRGGRVARDRAEVFKSSDIICQVRTPPANPTSGAPDLVMFRSSPEQYVVGHADPLGAADEVTALARSGVTSFALELMPRITRAQSMDVLSSQATIAGYKAVLIAAAELPMMMPMMMTAAGTVAAAKVLIIGAGVAGLQAIATSRRLGAIVSGYDIRPAVKEQVESLGATFVELELDAAESEGEGGYAKQMDDEFYRKQRELLGRAVADSDVVITTAAIPGKASPVLVTAEMVAAMKPGSVIVDLAAERGGNVEPSRADETVVTNGVTIFGPTNLPGTVPYHASQMYSRNVTTFLKHLVNDGAIALDLEDEITAGTLLTRGGEVVHGQVREHHGMSHTVTSESPAGGDA